MNEPLVSIITPVFNSEKYLSLTIDSVLKQTYQNWELWLINDCSADKSFEIMQSFAAKDHRIHSISLEKNSGPAVARNTGIEKAQGRYIAFLDADDIWKPEKLSVQIPFMHENNYALSYSHYEVMDQNSKLTGRTIFCPPTITYKKLLIENQIGCLTGVYDTEITGKVFMPLIYKRQDYGLWLNILRTGITGHGIQQSLANYRKYSTSLSGNKLGVLKYNWLLLRKYQEMNFLQSAYYFFRFLFHKGIKFIAKFFTQGK